MRGGPHSIYPRAPVRRRERTRQHRLGAFQRLKRTKHFNVPPFICSQNVCSQVTRH
jgi:hypothetical protein